MPHIDTQWIVIAIGALSLLVTLAGMGFFVRRASYTPALTVMEKTLNAYKEASVAEERAARARDSQILALQRQLGKKDKELADERERSKKLEALLADWQLEKQELLDRITKLEAEIRQLKSP